MHAAEVPPAIQNHVFLPGENRPRPTVADQSLGEGQEKEFLADGGRKVPRSAKAPRVQLYVSRLGRRFTSPPTEPIRLELMPNHPDELKELYKTHALVMSKRLLLALKEAGVDNLDTYECEIFHRKTSFSTRDWIVANLIGLGD